MVGKEKIGHFQGIHWERQTWLSSIPRLDMELFRQSPEPFPTMLVATASAALVAIIGVGLLVYFKKRNH